MMARTPRGAGRPGGVIEGIVSMRRTLSGGIAVLTMVGAGLTAWAPTASALELRGASADCVSGAGASSAKVADGGSLAADPNRLTSRQVEAREVSLNKQLAKRGLNRSTTSRLANGSVRVPVYVHVIRKNDGSGNTTNREVDRQITVLNRAFSGRTSSASVNTPFRFRLKDVDRTNNTDYYNWSISDDDRPAKRELHRGGFRALNLYVASLEDGLLGYATFPTTNNKLIKRDGVVLTKESLPGGAFGPYSRGDTATHEVGHWLNLYHTFQGGCSDPGDYVADTPRQRAGNNVFVCDPTLNTCGNNVGENALRDPVHNFLNYTDDNCIDRFSRGQEDRMEISYLAYRKGR